LPGTGWTAWDRPSASSPWFPLHRWRVRSMRLSTAAHRDWRAPSFIAVSTRGRILRRSGPRVRRPLPPESLRLFLEHQKGRCFREGLILAAELTLELSHSSPLLALLTLQLPASRGLVVVGLRAGLAPTADWLGIKPVAEVGLGSLRLAQRRRLQHRVELVLRRPALRTVIVVGKQSALPAGLLAPVG